MLNVQRGELPQGPALQGVSGALPKASEAKPDSLQSARFGKSLLLSLKTTLNNT